MTAELSVTTLCTFLREFSPLSYATDFLQPQRVAQFAFSPLQSAEITA
jgi:hypothetical protein